MWPLSQTISPYIRPYKTFTLHSADVKRGLKHLHNVQSTKWWINIRNQMLTHTLILYFIHEYGQQRLCCFLFETGKACRQFQSGKFGMSKSLQSHVTTEAFKHAFSADHGFQGFVSWQAPWQLTPISILLIRICNILIKCKQYSVITGYKNQ